jgi:4-hydroxybenzoate polyprenyltransferase
MRLLWKGTCAALAVTFLAAFGWFALTQDLKMSLWCMVAAIISVIIALVLEKDRL